MFVSLISHTYTPHSCDYAFIVLSDMAFGMYSVRPGAVNPRIVIVPLVAFDRSGGRLGYGGGFYDRTLEKLRAVQPSMAIGFAYAAQEDENLPLEPTDQPLDLIVTEHGIITP